MCHSHMSHVDSNKLMNWFPCLEHIVISLYRLIILKVHDRILYMTKLSLP